MADADIIKRGVPFRVTDPERIPTKRYFDEEFYRLEIEKLWPHVWQMACRLEQIPEVGDWIIYENLGKSVIIVRAKDGVKAFHNACRHRGVQLAEGHGNCKTQGFICPFHGWRWNMEGENTFVYGKHLFSEHQLETGDIHLIPCRSEVSIGCVFINFDDDAPSFRDSIGPMVDRFEAHGVSKLRAEWWYGTVLPANWKLAMEAFMEGFHVMRTHPQLHKATSADFLDLDGADQSGSGEGGLTFTPSPDTNSRSAIKAQFRQMELTGEGMAGMVHAKEVEIARQLLDVDLPEDPSQAVPMWFGMVQDAISTQLKARGEPVPDLNTVCVSDPVHAVEFFFPHYFLLPYFTSMSSYRIRPLGPESCFFELWSLTMFPEGEEPEPVMEPTVIPYDSDEFPPIPRQDYSNIPRQQIGLHATGFEFMRLAKDIEGLISNYQRIIDGYLAGVPTEKLAKANQLLAHNFDGKIEELGF